MISQRQYDRVTDYIKKGVEEGATALVGGPGAETGFDKGYFVRPTLFTDVDNKMTIAQEEIFGPVLSVIPFDDEEDAIRIANDSVVRLGRQRDVGLRWSIRWPSTKSHQGRLHRRQRRYAPYGADTPFGGYKDSGVGRQNGVAGFDQYTEVKSVGYPAV